MKNENGAHGAENRRQLVLLLLLNAGGIERLGREYVPRPYVPRLTCGYSPRAR